MLERLREVLWLRPQPAPPTPPKPFTPLKVLKAAQRQPDLVLDVGVRRGTPFLYEAFPDAEFLLVDPQRDGAALLEHKPQNFTFLNKAVGKRPGRMTIKEQDGGSTFLDRTDRTARKTEYEFEVEVTTLDVILDAYKTKQKVGLKLDVEGYELEALQGLDRHVGKIDFIVAEVSVLDRFEGGYDFSQLFHI